MRCLRPVRTDPTAPFGAVFDHAFSGAVLHRVADCIAAVTTADSAAVSAAADASAAHVLEFGVASLAFLPFAPADPRSRFRARTPVPLEGFFQYLVRLRVGGRVHEVGLYKGGSSVGPLIESHSVVDSDDEIGGKSPAAAPTPLRLASFNLWNTEGGWPERLDLVVSRLERVSADIIALQEVRCVRTTSPRGGGTSFHQMEQLALRLAHVFPHWVFAPGMHYVQSTPDLLLHSIEGVAVLSRVPIAAHAAHLLSRNFSDIEDAHQRVLLRASVSLPSSGSVGGAPADCEHNGQAAAAAAAEGAVLLDVFVCHMSLSAQSRLRNAEEIRRLCDATLPCAAAQFLVGDLNAEPVEPVYGYFVGPAGFEDVCAASNWTFSTLSTDVRKRIDYILRRRNPDRARADCVSCGDAEAPASFASELFIHGAPPSSCCSAAPPASVCLAEGEPALSDHRMLVLEEMPLSC